MKLRGIGLAVLALMSLWAGQASAQQYPTRPVKVLVTIPLEYQVFALQGERNAGGIRSYIEDTAIDAIDDVREKGSVVHRISSGQAFNCKRAGKPAQDRENAAGCLRKVG